MWSQSILQSGKTRKWGIPQLSDIYLNWVIWTRRGIRCGGSPVSKNVIWYEKYGTPLCGCQLFWFSLLWQSFLLSFFHLLLCSKWFPQDRNKLPSNWGRLTSDLVRLILCKIQTAIKYRSKLLPPHQIRARSVHKLNISLNWGIYRSIEGSLICVFSLTVLRTTDEL